MNIKKRRKMERLLVSVIMLFFFSAFLLASFKEGVDSKGLILSVVVPLFIYVATLWLPRFFSADTLLLALANFLCALGVLILYITDVQAGTNRGVYQAIYYGIGIVVMLVCIGAVRYIHKWRCFIWLVAGGSLLLMALPLVVGVEVNGATNWIKIGKMSLQPSELVKIALLFVLSHFMSRRRFIPWFLYAFICLLLLMYQQDLGTALIYYFTTLFLFFGATGKLLVTALGLIGSAGGAIAGYNMFAHVKKRVAIWHNPWIYYETSGYQIAQMLMAVASGGAFGVGLGLGAPLVIPAYFTDCIYAVICEQFGIIFGVLVLVMYVILVLRGTTIATSAKRSFHGLLAMGATVMLGLQTFVIIGGVLKLIPLTGVTMPFVSYGGTSLLSCMGLIGLLQGVNSLNQTDRAKEEKRYEQSHEMENEQQVVA